MRVLNHRDKMLVDVVSATVTYIGWADSGVNTNELRLSVTKLTFDADGNIVSQLWANGNGNFVNAWDNHTTFSYS